MTPMQAAEKFKAMLVAKYGEENTGELVIWDKDKCAAQGFGDGDAAICWEDGPFDWAIAESLTEFAVNLHNVLAEPYNGFVLNFYKNY